MKERIVRGVIELMFIVRYWVVLLLMSGLIYVTYKVYQMPGAQIRDVVAVFTGGSVFITIFYHVINYEYTQRKFKHDIKSAKDTLSFNIAMEWQKEYMTKNVNLLRDFHLRYKSFLDDGLPRKFQKQLDKPKNEACYTALLVVFNFYESLSLGVKQGIMDEEFIRGFFQSLFVTHYNRYISYIEYRRRETKNPKIWENFTYLANKWITLK